MAKQKDDQQQEETKYFEKLNIAVAGINKIKEIIKDDIKHTLVAWEKGHKVKKQPFRIIGPAGVGKTEICYQIAEELKNEIEKDFKVIMIKCPVLSRDDFIIPFPVTKDGKPKFKMLYSDYLPEGGDDSYGLFVIDEFSRGDHPLQQLMWQIQNECRIHLKDFPKNWFVISIDNPDEAEYSMDMLEDAAGLRRQLHVYAEVNVHDFLKYAISKDYHHLVIEFIQTHPDYLYDFLSQKQGAVFANPASWEKLSDHLWKFEANGGIPANYEKIEILASGLVNVNMTRLFMEFARDKKDINPKDVFKNYPKVKDQIEKLLRDGDNAKLGELMTGFCTFLTSSKPEYHDKELNNIADFLATVPIDTAAIFVSLIDGFARTSEEFKYVTGIHSTLMKKSEKYKKKFYEAIVDCGKKSQDS